MSADSETASYTSATALSDNDRQPCPVRRRLHDTRSADDHGPDEQLALVDQPGLESLRREVRTSYGEIAADRGLQLVYRGGVEKAFESGIGS